ncbi:LOW QUALITY PROTEIN: hypothetical protein PHMEG_00011320 [Phytophthora megakarya]|uniref:Uncharacterized protein n=1 Tax=Phytophthora megakarya TaxID=4795 RepID=A0A225WCX4_9STRA|nr:LOW QUALITY PROTEIN: hypothetical protein PHMEG_00011320 [Phytophthora megakarya]
MAAPPTRTTPSSSPTPVSVIQDEPSRMSALTYVAGQVRRWERVLRERVLPTHVRYTWPNTGRDFELWWTAIIATLRHLEGRTTSTALDEECISDLQLVRSELPTTQDVTPIVILTVMLSPRDCVALIQTLQLSQIAPSAVGAVVEGVQLLLSTVFIKWGQVAFGWVVNIQDGTRTIQDYHAEEADGGLLMTDHEAGHLGREFVLRLMVSKLRGLRCPRGSPSSESDLKRSLHVPPCPVSLSTPSLSSQPSYHSSYTNSQSVVTLNETISSIQSVSLRAGSDFVPSLFGTSETSIEQRAVVRKSSQDESSSSPVWSRAASNGYMPFRAYAPTVMTAKSGSVPADNQMGMQVVQTVIPPMQVMAGPDYVVMSESGEVAILTERRDISRRVDPNAVKATVPIDHPVALTPKCVAHDTKVPGAIQEGVEPSNTFRAT